MYKLLFIICFVFFIVRPGKGQVQSIDSLRLEFDKMYGLDVLLINGKKYLPDNNSIAGHPFWRSPEPFKGDLTISGKTFKDQRLKYNLYKQEFILVYTNLNGQQSQVILNSEVVDSVKTGIRLFEANKYPEINQRFVQLIYQNKLSCYIGWYKELQFNSTGPVTGYKYTDDYCKYYLISDNLVHQFTNKTSFLRIFAGKNRSAIRKYMRSIHFKFKNMDEKELKKLITYCENTVI